MKKTNRPTASVESNRSHAPNEQDAHYYACICVVMCVCMYFVIHLHAIRLLTQYKALKFDPIIRSCRKTFNELATQPKSFSENGCILIMSTLALFLTHPVYRCCFESARDPIALIKKTHSMHKQSVQN